jgi:7,8-dihydropterin-6-yl-methyl-4-(beta-D-ribofuranosyl)aminobenzene 5'-phosphate synthase
MRGNGELKNAKILNMYSDNVLAGKNLEGGWGLSFYVAVGEEEILFDLGADGEVLMHNIKALGLKAENIDKVVLSHAHVDHTGGLPSFLKSRTAATLPIIAHPQVLENKALLGSQSSIGFPKLSQELSKKITLHLSTNSIQVLPKLFTTGQISMDERKEKQGVASRALHEVNGKYEWDSVIDDLSLVLQAKDGLVVITGCCHAGILNTCAKATSLFKRKIAAIVGGTHMAEYSKEDIDHVGKMLETTYETPELYLCHCTGSKAITQLKLMFGSSKVHNYFAGTELLFEL